MIFFACRNRFEVHLMPYARNCQLQGGSNAYSSITVKPILVSDLVLQACNSTVPKLVFRFYGSSSIFPSISLLRAGPVTLCFVVCSVTASGLNIFHAFHLFFSPLHVLAFLLSILDVVLLSSII
ncbi:hypothetical protein C8J55DRAFT_271761 [Lentinula edodes]|uniref:Uncharacterized protein n=1 Tax=Lentinula lateritia TaxID=40482 RepID=A0A9W8ZRL1_9AGAR|nr:hypothetical protein C8J55DRAFT_271761 [Lentinula edodes]